MGILAEITGDESKGDNSRTFVLEGEGHTLGNSLKTIICRYPDVDFCGYTIPHPIQNKLFFRIQSQKSRAIDILKRGLDDLVALCDHTIDVFTKEVEAFEADKLDTGSEDLVNEDGDIDEKEEDDDDNDDENDLSDNTPDKD